MDVCLDHGIEGFKRYVVWAVVARNVHRIGAILWQQEVEAEQRQSKVVRPSVNERRTA